MNKVSAYQDNEGSLYENEADAVIGILSKSIKNGALRALLVHKNQDGYLMNILKTAVSLGMDAYPTQSSVPLIPKKKRRR